MACPVCLAPMSARESICPECGANTIKARLAVKTSVWRNLARCVCYLGSMIWGPNLIVVVFGFLMPFPPRGRMSFGPSLGPWRSCQWCSPPC
jgi:hypothetical protein